ncbi:MAG: hypothetical protein ACM3NV_08145, partial [Syntrophothermus sp.]
SQERFSGGFPPLTKLVETMTTQERHQKVRAARQRLHAQRMRAGALRGRVVVISLITFVILWGVVFVQMATGNDPVLAAKSASAKRHRGHAGGGAAAAGGAAEEPALEEPALEGVETSEPEVLGPEAVPVEEEFAELEPEPVEEEFAPVEEELVPLTTSQS